MLDWMVIGVLVATVPVLWKPRQFNATASFSVQGADPGRADLSALAGQLGIPVATSTAGQSPQFYAALLRTHVVQASALRDPVVVAEQGGKRTDWAALMGIATEDSTAREALAVAALRARLDVKVNTLTGVVALVVSTPWRSVSQQLAARLLGKVNEFNLKIRQQQASDERRFLDVRIPIARAALAESEEQVERFIRANRNYQTSPELSMLLSRMQRELGVRLQVVTSLVQSYEAVRLREVRDTPAITVVEPPMASPFANSRGLALRMLLGLFGGLLLAALGVFTRDVIVDRAAVGDATAIAVYRALQAFRATTLAACPAFLRPFVARMLR